MGSPYILVFEIWTEAHETVLLTFCSISINQGTSCIDQSFCKFTQNNRLSCSYYIASATTESINSNILAEFVKFVFCRLQNIGKWLQAIYRETGSWYLLIVTHFYHILMFIVFVDLSLSLTRFSPSLKFKFSMPVVGTSLQTEHTFLDWFS